MEMRNFDGKLGPYVSMCLMKCRGWGLVGVFRAGCCVRAYLVPPPGRSSHKDMTVSVSRSSQSVDQCE